MQKHASSSQESSPRKFFAPIPAAAESLIYYDIEPISLSYSANFTKLHFHDHYEIGFCLDGEGLICAEGVFSTFATGDIIFIPPNKYHYAHSLYTDQVCKLRFYYILPEAIERILNSTNTGSALTRPIPAVLRADEYPQAVATLSGIAHDGTFSEVIKTAIILRTATFLLESEQYFGIGNNSSRSKTSPSSNEATMLAEFLSAHYQENISAAELADMFHLSESQMRRKFVCEYGMPPIAYRNELRGNIGAELLIRTNFTICEIAERVGYLSSADFSRSFGKRFGISPGNYRKKYRK